MRLRWCVQNAVPIYGDTGLPYISKRKSTAAIDCRVAAAMAIGRAGDAGGRSIYEDEDEDERPGGLTGNPGQLLRGFWRVLAYFPE